MGNMTRDVELKTLASGQSVASFAIACSEKWKDKQGQQQEKTEFINCTSWGKTGELINRFFSKGSEILVEGKFTTDKYEKDGKTMYSSKVTVDQFTFTGGSKRGERQQEPHSFANPEAGEFYGFPEQAFTGSQPAPALPVDEDIAF
jgi:single-strand DNA-binding protein